MTGAKQVGRDDWLTAWHNAPHAHQTAAEQATIVAFALYADPETGMNVRPAQATIAAKVGLSVWTVGKAIRQAVRDGWFIEVSSGRGRAVTSCYRLANPTLTLADVQPSIHKSAHDVSNDWHQRHIALLAGGRSEV